MSIRMMAAAVTAAAAMVMAMCGTAVAATSRAARPAVQLTGVRLRAALLPRSDFPAGYIFQKSGVYDSGRHLEKASAKYHLATMSCTSFAKNFGESGFGETATASDIFENSPHDTGAFLQTVYQFKAPKTATSFFGGLFAIAVRCEAFLFPATSDGKTEAFMAPPVGGHRTFQVDQTGFFLVNVMTEIDSVVTVAGTDVFVTSNLGANVAPPGSPSARTSMLRLIKRVEAFR
jgi:hypothetical protein